MRGLAVASVVALVLAGAVAAAETQATAVVCRNVENRTPQGAGEQFPADVGQLFCFSEVKNGEGSVVHVWFYGDKEVARIELPVSGARYRTWSKKRILPNQTGSWRVEVQDREGHVLAQQAFTIK